MNPDLVALLAACRDAPADDTPRGVLADWLDDNADTSGLNPDDARARAQLIRVQVELARPTSDEARVVQLRAEQARLLGAHAARWLGDMGAWLWQSRQRQRFGFGAGASPPPVPPFDPHATHSGWRFDRGLLTLELQQTELTEPNIAAWFASPMAAWVEEAAVDVSGLAALERLVVRDSIRPYVGIRYALGAIVPSMRFAPPAPEAITPADARRLTRCPNFALVRSLHVYPPAVEGKVMAALITAEVRGIRRLTVKSPLDDTSAAFLGVTPLVGLSALDVSGCALTASGLHDIVRSPHLTQLTSLIAFRNRFGCDGLVALAASPLAGRLTVLELQNTQIGDRGATAMAESTLLERVIGPGLNLMMNPIADAGAAALARCPHLAKFTELILRDCRVGSVGAKALADSPHLADLTCLDLWKNRVGNGGARALAESPHLGDLAALSLRDNRITARGAKLLAARFGTRAKV